MKQYFLFFILICGFTQLFAQSQKDLVKELEARRQVILDQIKTSEAMLDATNNDVSNQLNNLLLLSNHVGERKRYINQINNDLKTIEGELTLLQEDLVKLEGQLAERKAKYEASLHSMKRNRSIEDRLLFIFSAKSFQQTYRRVRYVNEYAEYQRMEGKEIQQKQSEIEEKSNTLTRTKDAKEKLLAEREKEQKYLEEQERKLQDLIVSLQRKQKELNDEIGRKRKEADALNITIDVFVAEEIERVRHAGELEAKLERESAPEGQESTSRPPMMGGFEMTKADRALSGTFLSNRGRLPMPVTGTYSIVSRFGQNSVSGLRHVTLENKGLDIQTVPGAQAKAVFEGVVSEVFQFPGNGLYNVLIRHGNYITAYCNLSSPTVKKGEKVTANQTLGQIFSDSSNDNRTILHFQLRQEKSQLNPEPWLRK